VFGYALTQAKQNVTGDLCMLGKIIESRFRHFDLHGADKLARKELANFKEQLDESKGDM